MIAPHTRIPRVDVTRIDTAHRKALHGQWSEVDLLVAAGIFVVVGCALIGLLVGIAFWGWQ